MHCCLTNTGKTHCAIKTLDSAQQLSIPPKFLFNDLINSQLIKQPFFLNST